MKTHCIYYSLNHAMMFLSYLLFFSIFWNVFDIMMYYLLYNNGYGTNLVQVNQILENPKCYSNVEYSRLMNNGLTVNRWSSKVILYLICQCHGRGGDLKLLSSHRWYKLWKLNGCGLVFDQFIVKLYRRIRNWLILNQLVRNYIR